MCILERERRRRLGLKSRFDATTRVNPLDLGWSLNLHPSSLLTLLCVVRHKIYYALLYKNVVYSTARNQGKSKYFSLWPGRLRKPFHLLSAALLPARFLRVHRFSGFPRCMCRHGFALKHQLERSFRLLCRGKRLFRRLP